MAHRTKPLRRAWFCDYANRIHLLWRMSNLHNRFNVQGALLSYTAHRFKAMAKVDGQLFKHFVADKDRAS